MNEGPFAAVLSSLPGMGPATLAALLREHTPLEAWNLVLSGGAQRPAPRAGRREASSWAGAAARLDPEAMWAPAAARGIRVTWIGETDFPVALAGDPAPPGVIFWRGSLGWLERPCVSIVGTRNATPEGLAVAYEMGRDLAASGVCVVSGLALGIDGSAHRGALVSADEAGFAGPVAVAASGVDVPYPRRHSSLWSRVAEAGAVISETPPGRPAQAWRFPCRNRIIAGLSRMVVVVESHAAGGSLITAEAAIERGIEVRAVPGAVRSPASAGSNQLLYDGPGPVRHARDVLDAIGILLPDPPSPAAGGSRTALRGERRGMGGALPALGLESAHVLDALGRRPAALGQVVDRTGLSLPAVAQALDELEAMGAVTNRAGWWART